MLVFIIYHTILTDSKKESVDVEKILQIGFFVNM